MKAYSPLQVGLIQYPPVERFKKKLILSSAFIFGSELLYIGFTKVPQSFFCESILSGYLAQLNYRHNTKIWNLTGWQG